MESRGCAKRFVRHCLPWFYPSPPWTRLGCLSSRRPLFATTHDFFCQSQLQKITKVVLVSALRGRLKALDELEGYKSYFCRSHPWVYIQRHAVPRTRDEVPHVMPVYILPDQRRSRERGQGGKKLKRATCSPCLEGHSLTLLHPFFSGHASLPRWTPASPASSPLLQTRIVGSITWGPPTTCKSPVQKRV